MTQELIDLRQSILDGRYQDALDIIDELEGMSKQAILRNIESCLVRLLVHLIKIQIEKRTTKSWRSSIANSIVKIKKLNLKDNKKSYYLESGEWQEYLAEALNPALNEACLEVKEGIFDYKQLKQEIDKNQLFNWANSLLNLTYKNSTEQLSEMTLDYLESLV
ncbi:protein of unknown function DUF29 [Stanieria cyanosphaera PCC 7437]|uniref:DUF29 domain-containing protein n=1 Tax=Stanieria cyanosphaera (strain ATCC 29371 / PCC 7437) TaxID=111780 RepID=K9XQE3_STAC7|nr:DUF29 family protein [Stanieria cyanosphaera]AFZ34840.1 protein of unknown function DUF29 [Stanieria cyanosphaera PCC 7437]